MDKNAQVLYGQYQHLSSLLSSWPFASISSESLVFTVPKIALRNKVGLIVDTVVNRVLTSLTTNNLYGNTKYNKHFMQGTIVNAYGMGDTHRGRRNIIWK